MKRLLGLILGTALATGFQASALKAQNLDDGTRMTLVLSAPRAGDGYYARVYDDILAFQLAFARAIMPHDNVVILADDAAYRFFARELPEGMLLRRPMADIWARDFTTVAPASPLRFRYAAAAQGGDQSEADFVQRGFTGMAENLGLDFATSGYILDGGNFVGDGRDKVIVTDRFLEDNGLSKQAGVAALKQLLGAGQVAIIPTDDPDGLAHADGMVMFTDPDTLFVTEYDEPLRAAVIGELRAAFPDVKIVELPVEWDDRVWDPKFGSACGIYANSVVTGNAVYLPQFGGRRDREALELIRRHSAKAVVPISAETVCFMGGSARCLVWQVTGTNAAKLLAAAHGEP